MEDRPIIITLKLDGDSQTFFNRLREQFFPPERNYLKAHLTLFHLLPASKLSPIQEELNKLATSISPFKLQVEAPKSIGRGVAYPLLSDRLKAIHHQLQKQWQTDLTSQDKQKLWPHITVQNKVAPQQAKELLQKLTHKPFPEKITALGFSLFYYNGGPWEWIEDISFSVES